MKRFLVISAAIFALTTTAAVSQAPQVKGDKDEQMTNCPPNNPANSQELEKSAILPSAGGYDKSAAPTVQRQGETVVSDTDTNCAPPKDQQKN